MKLYLAGPMSGYPEHNYPLFHAETARLREMGWTVVNPAEINPPNAGGWANCMKRDIAELVDCRRVATLPGWQDSKGASLEVHIAEALGIPHGPAEEIDGGPVTPLADLAREIIDINTYNGWNVLQPEQWADTYKVPAILGLVHSEVSEALEAFRKGDREGFAEEMADVLIRVLDCTEGLHIDIDAVVAAKLAKNRKRGFRHGGKRV